ncbi:MAG: hypothetical protein ACO3B4_01070 [Burkholderiaceae bacterium]
MAVALPNLEQYLRALQQPPRQVFADPHLHEAKIETNALGMPRARSGNFALVFKATAHGKVLALRCFTRVSKEIEQRYGAIAKATRAANRSLGRETFVAFDYEPQGMLVEGNRVPLVKMAWAKGQTLGDYLAIHHKDTLKIRQLRLSLRELCTDLRRLEIAHGDIQLGNILVSPEADSLTLIDYDGMFVPELSSLKASELGHVNFQHPLRNEGFFNLRLDDFAFIVLDLSLHLLEAVPEIYDRTYSDEEGLVFRGTDFADPLASQTFGMAARVASLSVPVKQFALICMAPIDRVPRAEDFYRGNVPVKDLAAARPAKPVSTEPAASRSAQPPPPKVYLGSFEVVAAASFSKVARLVGRRIELIGQVVEVRAGKTRFGSGLALRPYIYIDFQALSSGNVVRVKILPELLETPGLDSRFLPNYAWVGQWVAVTEVVQPIHYLSHPSFSGGIGEASLVVNSPAQIHRIPVEEARFRLAGNNQAAKQRLKTRAVSTRLPRHRNQQILAQIKRS